MALRPHGTNFRQNCFGNRSGHNHTCRHTETKSDNDQKSCLYLLDDPDTIRSKLKVAITDNTSAVTFDPIERPGVSNLVCIHSRITGSDFYREFIDQ